MGILPSNGIQLLQRKIPRLKWNKASHHLKRSQIKSVPLLLIHQIVAQKALIDAIQFLVENPFPAFFMTRLWRPQKGYFSIAQSIREFYKSHLFKSKTSCVVVSHLIKP